MRHESSYAHSSCSSLFRAGSITRFLLRSTCREPHLLVVHSPGSRIRKRCLCRFSLRIERLSCDKLLPLPKLLREAVALFDFWHVRPRHVLAVEFLVSADTID